MQRLLFYFLFFLLAPIALFGQINIQWETRFNGTGSFIDKPIDMELDGSGNTYVTGSSYTGPANGYDFHTVKYDSDGAVIWSQTYGGSGLDEVQAMVMDGAGNIIVTGSRFVSGSDWDVVTIKYNGSTGVVMFTSLFSGSTLFDGGRDVTVDASDNIIVTGTYSYSASDKDYIVIKYNSAGTVLWSYTTGTGLADSGEKVLTDAAGNIYVGGFSEVSGQGSNFMLLRFGPGGGAPAFGGSTDSGFLGDDAVNDMAFDNAGNIVLVGEGYQGALKKRDYCIMKFSATCAFIWQRTYSGDGDGTDILNAVAIDQTTNDIYVTGRSQSTATSADYNTMKYSPSGTLLWEDRYTTAGLNYDEGIDLQLVGTSLYVTGYSYKTGSNNDYTTLKYNQSTGDVEWVTRFNGPAGLSDQAVKMQVDPTENIFVTGSSHGGSGTNLDYSTIKYCQLTTIASADTALCLGQSVDLTASGGSNITWTVLSGDMASLSCSVCASSTATPNTSSVYTVSSESASGCIDYDTVYVDVNPIPAPTIYHDTPLDFCAGGSVILYTDTYAEYLWSTTEISNAITVSLAGTYDLTITDTNGCQNTVSETVSTFALPSVTLGPDATICPGNTYSLDATGALSYLWTPNPTLSSLIISNPDATPTISPTSYIVEGTDINGCKNKDTIVISWFTVDMVDAGLGGSVCVGDAFPISASGVSAYIWDASPTLSSLVIPNPMASPTVLTKYYVTGIDDNGCESRDSVSISTIGLPTISAGADTTICEGTSVQLHATGGLSSLYVWDADPTLSSTTVSNPFASPFTNTQYFVSGTDINGCSNTDSVTVTINPLPMVSAGPDDSFCIGDSIQLNASGAIGYTWNSHPSLSSLTISNPWAKPVTMTTYIVTGVDAFGCENTDLVTISINDLPIVNAGADASVCLGDTVQLNATGGTIYIWDIEPSLSDYIIADPFAFPTTDITYSVTVTDINGCSASDEVDVTVLPLPAPPVITLSTPLIVSSYTLSGSHQWYVDGDPILGETDYFINYISVGINGAYWVLYTDDNGCSAFSDTVFNTITIFDIGFEDSNDDLGILVYPNPTSGIVNINSDGELDQLFIMNSNGQIVYTENKINDSLIALDLNGLNLSDGVYFVRILKGDRVMNYKIIKE